MEAADGDTYPFDLLVSAAASRAIFISRGFRTLMQDRNYVTAYPLVRLALDCCICLQAGHMVDNIYDFSLHIIGGGRPNKYKSNEGRELKDGYLVDKLSAKYPELGVSHLYSECSGRVHMSTSHIVSTTSVVETDERALRIRVEVVRELPESEYIGTTLYLKLSEQG